MLELGAILSTDRACGCSTILAAKLESTGHQSRGHQQGIRPQTGDIDWVRDWVPFGWCGGSHRCRRSQWMNPMLKNGGFVVQDEPRVGRATREPRGQCMPRVDRLDAFADPRRLSEKIK
jgi:hypothetical protein